MSTTELEKRQEEVIKQMIRQILTPKGKDVKDHLRFNMSGYDTEGVGSCTLHNQSVLNHFAFMGIYDYSDYFCLNFHKGTPFIYYECTEYKRHEEELSGYGTVDIIYRVLQVTCMSNKPK